MGSQRVGHGLATEQQPCLVTWLRFFVWQKCTASYLFWAKVLPCPPPPISSLPFWPYRTQPGQWKGLGDAGFLPAQTSSSYLLGPSAWWGVGEEEWLRPGPRVGWGDSCSGRARQEGVETAGVKGNSDGKRLRNMGKDKSLQKQILNSWLTDFSTRMPNSMGKNSFQQMVLGQLDIHMEGMKLYPLPHTIHKN